VLDDLALEAVVVVRVRRAARNLGRIDMRVKAGMCVGVPARSAALGAMAFGR